MFVCSISISYRTEPSVWRVADVLATFVFTQSSLLQGQMNFVEYCLVPSFFSSSTVSFMPPLYLYMRKCAVFFPTGNTSPQVITCVQSVFPSRMNVPCRPVPHSYNSSAGHWCQTQWLVQTKHSVKYFFWMNAGQDEQKGIFVLLYIWLCWSIWIFFFLSIIHSYCLSALFSQYLLSVSGMSGTGLHARMSETCPYSLVRSRVAVPILSILSQAAILGESPATVGGALQ